MADIFTKPFTDRAKWQHALRLIARSDSFHTSKVARGNLSQRRQVQRHLATPFTDTSSTSEILAASLLKSKDYSYDALEKLLGMIFEDGKCLAHLRMDHFVVYYKPHAVLPAMCQVHQSVSRSR